jgi:hypothetical protein
VLLYHKVSKIVRGLESHIIATLVFKVLSHDARGEERKRVKERAMPFLRCKVLQAMLANERGVYMCNVAIFVVFCIRLIH